MEKWIARLQAPEETAQILQLLENQPVDQSVICFDYFDTIVTRCVPPEYTKQIAASLLSRLLGDRVTGDDIYTCRKEIERRLCEKKLKESGELEFRFEDLSKILWNQIDKKHRCTIIDNGQKLYQQMLKIEVAVEKKVQLINPDLLHVLKQLYDAHFKLCLISDFYLPEEQFREILRWHDLEYLFSDVYVSSDRGVSKGSGSMYPLICSELQVAPDQLVMIGDNDHADVRMAAEHGLRAIHLKPGVSKVVPGQLEKNPNRRATKLFNEIQIDREQPFSEMGVSLWYFTHRLFQKLHEGGVRDVFFLSKEGEFLKTIFELYQTELFGTIPIRAHYLLVSRKSTFIASLRPLEEEDFSRLLDHYRDISLKDFLQSLNFRPEDIAKLCTVSDIDYDQRLVEIKNHSAFKSLLKNDIFQQVYEQRRCEQKGNFLNYLDSFHIQFPGSGLHLVDVGWKGSIQDNIYHILDRKTVVTGYFVGLLNPTEQYENNKKTGILYNVPKGSAYFSVYNNNRSLFEMMLGASHGSADYYLGEPAGVNESVGNDVRWSKQPLLADHPCVVTLDLPEERELFSKLIEPLQKNMFLLSSSLNKAYMIAQDIPPARWFARHHARMVYMPRQQEISFFESLYHLENFGIFEFTDFSVKRSHSFGEKAKNVISVIRNPQLLETGIWPPIILKNMGIGWFRHFDGRRRHKNDI